MRTLDAEIFGEVTEAHGQGTAAPGGGIAGSGSGDRGKRAVTWRTVLAVLLVVLLLAVVAGGVLAYRAAHKTVTLDVDGRLVRVTTFATNVPLRQRVGTVEERTTTAIPFESVRRANPALYSDLPERVVRAGVEGVRTRVFEVVYVDGEEKSRREVSDDVTREPVDEIVEYGTLARPEPDLEQETRYDTEAENDAYEPYEAPPPSAATTETIEYAAPAPAPAAPAAPRATMSSGSMAPRPSTGMTWSPGAWGPAAGGAGGAPVPTGDVWAALGVCESSGDPATDTGNGYYGLYQFSLATWRATGGSGLPSEASAAEQTMRAQVLQEQAGWGQWPACSAALGLR
ncbi:resuscitation-promoting factor [Myceligenerans crystallogenes]|uniref:G5 domain-containing protein n=1 Tax=Myceligenerans crystallogenes TaxID=316335 RepID=A0ABN2NAX5_9MICO